MADHREREERGRQEPGSPRSPASGAIEVVALAASAGGLQALAAVLSGLPAVWPVALLVVQHLDRRYPRHLAEILARRTAFPLKAGEDGEEVRPGQGYIAPTDRHLLVSTDRRVSLTASALVHFVRPSADLMFQSVAACYGERSVAVVLSGSGRDGAEGVAAIHAAGGLVMVQDARSAEFSGMPRSAIETGFADRVLPLEAIGPALVALAADGQEGR
jgi:two-component system chemotaxis response regulator CheB